MGTIPSQIIINFFQKGCKPDVCQPRVSGASPRNG